MGSEVVLVVFFERGFAPGLEDSGGVNTFEADVAVFVAVDAGFEDAVDAVAGVEAVEPYVGRAAVEGPVGVPHEPVFDDEWVVGIGADALDVAAFDLKWLERRACG